jgi:hypothetical protein
MLKSKVNDFLATLTIVSWSPMWLKLLALKVQVRWF